MFLHPSPIKTPPSVPPSKMPRIAPIYTPPSKTPPSITPTPPSPYTPPYKSPYPPVSKPLATTPKKYVIGGAANPTKDKTVPGYDVYVKRKQAKTGKGNYLTRGYTRANKKPLSERAAFMLGGGIVDKYTNRSFFMKKSDKSAKPTDVNPQAFASLQKKFRGKKGNRKIYVEKTAHAIDSRMEKQGIPFESMRLRKAGKLKVKKRKKSRRKKK